VLLIRPSHTLPMAYYGPVDVPYEELPFLFDKDEREAYLATEMGPRMAQLARQWDGVWLISSVENTDPHGFPQRRQSALERLDEKEPIVGWLNAHYVLAEQRSFTGIDLRSYDLRGSGGPTP